MSNAVHGLRPEEVAKIKAAVRSFIPNEGDDYKDVAASLSSHIADELGYYPDGMPCGDASPRKFLDWKAAVLAA